MEINFKDYIDYDKRIGNKYCSTIIKIICSAICGIATIKNTKVTRFYKTLINQTITVLFVKNFNIYLKFIIKL